MVRQYELRRQTSPGFSQPWRLHDKLDGAPRYPHLAKLAKDIHTYSISWRREKTASPCFTLLSFLAFTAVYSLPYTTMVSKMTSLIDSLLLWIVMPMTHVVRVKSLKSDVIQKQNTRTLLSKWWFQCETPSLSLQHERESLLSSATAKNASLVSSAAAQNASCTYITFNSCCNGCGYSFTSNDELKKAVEEFEGHKANVTDKYGTMNCWDVSWITDIWVIYSAVF